MPACCAPSPAPKVKNVAALVGLYQALADATRLRILAILTTAPEASGELCVCHIHECLGVSQPAASRHLAYLRRAGLVEARREGVWMHYRLVRQVDPVRAAVLDAALHALGHVSTTERDRTRLARVTAAPSTPAA